MTAPNAGAKAELIGTYLEILCYGTSRCRAYYEIQVDSLTGSPGIYLVVFYKCLGVLGAKYIEGRPTATLLCTAFTIFALVTVVSRLIRSSLSK